MIAVDLWEQISAKYPGRNAVIEVAEDGENGAIMEFNGTANV